MAKTKVGIQLIVYGNRVQSDLPGIAAEVAWAGYEGIETGTYVKQLPAAEAKALLEKHGLELCGIHCGYGDFTNEEILSENIAYLKALNSRYLICSGVALGEGIEAYDTAAKTFNRVGKRCLNEGLVFCYHNHAFEFKSLDGVKGIHRLTERTDPEFVKLCIDVYWVHVGGEDPSEFIRRYADRAGYYHFKDGGEGWFTELGKGEVNLRAAKEAAMATAAYWIVYEQDSSDQEVKQSVVESRQYLRQLGL